MSNYTLNNKPMRTAYSWYPGKQRQDNSNISVRGILDMPARIGKTFHDWGYLQGIEPYVLASEIRYGGRDINFTGHIYGTSKKDCLDKVYSLYSDLDAFTSPVPLVSDKWGLWNVIVNGEIQADYVGDGWLKLDIPFREPIVDISGTIPAIVTPGAYGIDNITFDNLGFTLLSMQQQMNRPAPKSGNFTAYATEGYRITPTGSRDIKVAGYIDKATYQELKNVLRGLYALFSKAGLRKILKPNDVLRDFFVKDGIEVSEISVGQRFTAYIEFTITEVGFSNLFYLTDNVYNYITTNAGERFITTF